MSRDFKPLPLTTDYSLYERGSHDITVVGSLRRHISHFETLGAPAYILQIIRAGYVLPLATNVPGTYLRNNRSSRDCPHFVQGAIDNLLLTGAIIELPSPPRVVNPLTVASGASKPRLVLDLRHVNRRLKKHTCKIENATILAKYLPNAKFMFGFDLKSGYHHLDIHPAHHELLGFAYHDYTGKIRYFCFRVLPFGLATAGFIFTQVLRVLIHAWRRAGICVLAYFDDGTSTASNFNEAYRNSSLIKADLLASGFIPNCKKSQWYPTQFLVWLGFLYDLIRRKITATQERLDKTFVKMSAIDTSQPVHIKQVAAVTGAIISLHLAYGDVVYLKTKRLQIAIANERMEDGTQAWDRMLVLPPECLADLHFWQNYLIPNNGMFMHTPLGTGALSFSDASDTGCAAIITPYPGEPEVKIVRPLTPQESVLSSTFRELLAVEHSLKQAQHILAGRTIRWFTDSQNIVSIVRKGSMKTHLLALALSIFETCKSNNICLSLSWIPRTMNDRADYYSRITDQDDWGIHPNWFKHICRLLGPVDIDRFADVDNRKTLRFNSRFFHPESEGTDAFTQTWTGCSNWLVPPTLPSGKGSGIYADLTGQGDFNHSQVDFITLLALHCQARSSRQVHNQLTHPGWHLRARQE